MYFLEGIVLPFCHFFWFDYWPVSLSCGKGVRYLPLWFSFECIYEQRALYVFLLHMNMNLFMNIGIKNSSAGCTISRFRLPGHIFFPKGNSDRMIAHHISIISSKVRIKRSWIIRNRLKETSTCHLISFSLLSLSSKLYKCVSSLMFLWSLSWDSTITWDYLFQQSSPALSIFISFP